MRFLSDTRAHVSRDCGFRGNAKMERERLTPTYYYWIWILEFREKFNRIKKMKKKQKNRPFKTRQPSRIPSFPLKSVRSRCATTRIENLQLTTEYLTVAILIFYVWQEKKNITTRDFQSIRTTFGSNEPLVSFYWYRYEIGDSLGGYVTLCKTRYKTNTSERHIWIKTYSSAIPYFVTLIIIYYNFYDLSVEKKKY